MIGSGVLIYKCRKCSKIDASYGVPDLQRALIELTLYQKTSGEEMVAHMCEVHNCADGTLGVTDLIGGREEPN